MTYKKILFSSLGQKVEIQPGLVYEQEWIVEVRPGGWCLAIHSQGQRRRFMYHEQGKTWSASFQGALWQGQQEHLENQSFLEEEAGLIVAEFPGRVRQIFVQSGAEVHAGDSLAVLEAMKMEFFITAPSDGHIVEIKIQESQQVCCGDSLFVLER